MRGVRLRCKLRPDSDDLRFEICSDDVGFSSTDFSLWISN